METTLKGLHMLANTPWSSQELLLGHWPPCTNLWHNSKMGLLRCNTGNKNEVLVALGINMFSFLFVLLLSCIVISPQWTTYVTSTRDVGSSSYSSIFTLRTLLLIVWCMGWSFAWSHKHVGSQWPLKLQWWKKFMVLLQKLLNILLLSMFLYVYCWNGKSFLPFLLWKHFFLWHVACFSQQDASKWSFFPQKEHTLEYQQLAAPWMEW